MRLSVPQTIAVLSALVLAALVLASCTSSEEVVDSAQSPGGEWEARLYYVNPGAAATATSRAEVIELETGAAHDVWIGPSGASRLRWAGSHTLVVGEQTLDVRKGVFDWFKDAPDDGLDDPDEAVRLYVSSLAAGDIPGLRRAGELLVEEGADLDLRQESFGTTRTLDVASLSLERVWKAASGDQIEYLVRVVASPAAERGEYELNALAVEEGGMWRVNYADAAAQDAD